MHVKVPMTFTANTSSHSSTVSSSKGRRSKLEKRAALLTNASTLPNFDTVVAASCCASCGDRMSALTNRVRELEAVSFLISGRSEEHTSELQSRLHLVCRL